MEHNGGTLEGGYALYDILMDPLEKSNIIKENSETAEQLKMELDQWFEGIKQAPHSFNMPMFLIGKDGRRDNIIKGQATVRISSNLKNTFGTLNGWREVGDFAEYSIEVITPGDYSININHASSHASGAGIVVSVGAEWISGSILDKQKTEPGVISLKKGKAILRLEITDVPEGSPDIVMDKLRSIELVLQ